MPFVPCLPGLDQLPCKSFRCSSDIALPLSPCRASLLIFGFLCVHHFVHTCRSLGAALTPFPAVFPSGRSGSGNVSVPSRYRADFVQQRRLGKGGFGTVYQVKHKVDGQQYAVKKIKFSFQSFSELKDAYSRVSLPSFPTCPTNPYSARFSVPFWVVVVVFVFFVFF